MPQDPTYTYEGLFLFPQSASVNLQGAVDHLKGLLSKIDAEIISFSKWDERRLAYEIKGNKRGIYFLTYFKATASKLVILERSCNLSEQLLRFMYIRADLIPQEVIEAADGQSKLADEITLRTEQAASGEATTSDSSRVGAKEVPEAKPAAAPKASEPAKTEEAEKAGKAEEAGKTEKTEKTADSPKAPETADASKAPQAKAEVAAPAEPVTEA